ncbi:MAG: C10 family peptidase [Bacteroidales bacterium]|nr:C10 family peptidase [Bacteroidales bacterium]
MQKLKQFLAFAMTIVLLSACTSNEEGLIDEEFVQVQESINPYTRTLSEARIVANNAISMLEGTATTRSGKERRTIDASKTKIVRTAQTRSEREGSDTLLYVFNFDDNQGFAVVSANKATEGLIAITESGYYDPAEKQENEAFAAYMDAAEEYVSTPRLGARPILPPISFCDTLWLEDVAPRVSVKWGQEWPYGIYCPNGLCGCAATALSQIMSYFEYPTSINITFDTEHSGTLNLNWDNIRQHVKSVKHVMGSDTLWICQYNCSTDTHNAIGLLCREIGHRAQSQYIMSPRVTWTYDRDFIPAILSFGFATSCTDFHEYPLELARTELQNGIIIMGGSREPNNVGGHYWIIDGYKYFSVTSNETAISPGGGTLPEEGLVTTYYTYNHINWGWNGKNNGYYEDNVFNTMYCRGLDDGSSLLNNTYNFQYDLRFVRVTH